MNNWTKGAKYWDKAWNPVVGCKPVSEGCDNCYAKAMWQRFNPGSDFKPEHKKKRPPRKGVVFAGNMTDLFGDWNDDSQILDWLSALNPFCIANLILTKRASRMRDFFSDVICYENITKYKVASSCWFGVTAENQARADERIPKLIKTIVLKKWLSLEPLLGPVDLYSLMLSGIDWVVVGAESGPNRRECKIEWIESIVEQCQSAHVPVFVKQIHVDGKLVTDISQFPKHLQIRQVPFSTVISTTKDTKEGGE